MSDRKIQKYSKSIRKYKGERQRRKKIIELVKQGFKIRDIAQRLGISRRTVSRDIKKVEPYHMSIIRKEGDDLIRQVSEAVRSKSTSEQIKIIGALMNAKPRKQMEIVIKLLKEPA